MYKDNPAYEHRITIDGVSLYTPVNIADGYHTARYVEALNLNTYAAGGALPKTLEEAMDEILLRCNKELKIDTLRTDIGNIATSVKYRLKYPVDQHCGIRMGCLLSFVEYEQEGKLISEDPNKVEILWMDKKEKLAHNNPDAYTFFLTWGILNTPAYKNHWNTLEETDYFRNRDENLRSLSVTKLSSSK